MRIERLIIVGQWRAVKRQTPKFRCHFGGLENWRGFSKKNGDHSAEVLTQIAQAHKRLALLGSRFWATCGY